VTATSAGRRSKPQAIRVTPGGQFQLRIALSN